MRPNVYDVLIVGSRPAGAATAMLLARTGARVLAVDWRAPGDDTISTHAIMRGGVMQLARWGLLGRLRDAGTPAIRRMTFHYGDEAVPIDIRPDGAVDALQAPRRTLLDQVLADAAWSAGAEMRYGTSFRDVVRDASGRVAGAVLTTADGMPFEVSARLVVGADGRRSSVARRVGAAVLSRSRHATASAYGYLPGLGDAGTHWYYREGIAAGRIPTNDGLHCMFVTLSPGRYEAERRAATSGDGLKALLAEAHPALAAEIAGQDFVARPIGFGGQHGHVRKSHGPGWALVGDAGYFKDPLTAHGITDALRDAELLVEAILAGSDSALARYQAVRDAISRDLYQVTDEIAALDWTMADLHAMHMRLSAAMKEETLWMAETFAERAAAA